MSISELLFNTCIKTHENQANRYEVGEVFPWKLLKWWYNFYWKFKYSETPHESSFNSALNLWQWHLFLVNITQREINHWNQHRYGQNSGVNVANSVTAIKHRSYQQMHVYQSVITYGLHIYQIFFRIIVKLGILIYSMKRMVQKCGFGPSRLQELKYQLRNSYFKQYLYQIAILGDVFKFIDHQWEYWQKILCDPGEI